MNVNMMCWSQPPQFFNYSYSPHTQPTDPTYAVCTAPLVAPKPLPYHSPTFLQFMHLPELDQDLSHPPYATREPASKVARTVVKKNRALPYPHPSSRPRKTST
ncbi:hypothetical protein CYLTODRAFT_409359 [Cylindrobasidium torrendii FP15055 ss-10]|uniref:Uncharacterized protein n=1 Tax=Cylindrobasidium torrendii FP15055 ss-10 TaxID=1314674 RepID=A0A0D7BHU9_9AGAR|nr:hypothetical protein CYLTODRAFT_409359 [Cylindrobasidium torrendii FP15055 ss-10]